MDPNLFHLDYERLVEVLATIVILSFFVERALSVVFASRWFINMPEGNPKRKGLKELIALAVAGTSSLQRQQNQPFYTESEQKTLLESPPLLVYVMPAVGPPRWRGCEAL